MIIKLLVVGVWFLIGVTGWLWINNRAGNWKYLKELGFCRSKLDKFILGCFAGVGGLFVFVVGLFMFKEELFIKRRERTSERNQV